MIVSQVVTSQGLERAVFRFVKDDDGVSHLHIFSEKTGCEIRDIR